MSLNRCVTNARNLGMPYHRKAITNGFVGLLVADANPSKETASKWVTGSVMKTEDSSRQFRWSNSEPDLQEVLSDPIVRTVMERDGVTAADLSELALVVRKRQIAQRWRGAP